MNEEHERVIDYLLRSRKRLTVDEIYNIVRMTKKTIREYLKRTGREIN